MISVLVVDDSVVIRRLVTDALAEDPKVNVVGTAANGRIALAKIETLRPDIITLDVEMPVMDGLETLRALRPKYPRLPIIMFSTLTASGATATLDALAAGATDYVTKPANVGSVRESIRSVREQLLPRIHALCEPRKRPAPVARPLVRPAPGGLAAPGGRPSLYAPRPGLKPPGVARVPVRDAPVSAGKPVPVAVRPARPVLPPHPARPIRTHIDRVGVVAIGCSTGGPDALTKILRALPKDWPVPIVVVQHMPPVFTKMFAERLDRVCALTVVEVLDNMPVWPGSVYIAPGDLHFEVVRRGHEVAARVKTGPPENFCRPAVDVLFRSVNRVYGRSTLAVILTGMGHDGRRGCEALCESGAEILAQDEASSVVWGMPGAVTNAGLADVVLPLDEMASHLISRVTGGRRTSSMEVTR